MSADEQIRVFANYIVVVDDAFAPAKLEGIEQEHWGELRDADHDTWLPLQQEFFPNIEKPVDLKRSDEDLKRAWELYEATPDKLAVLDPIFRPLSALRKVGMRRLEPLVDYFEKDLGIRVIKHASIEEAEEDIKRCKIVFLDFFLKPATTELIIEENKKWAPLFSAPIGETGLWRIVYLISTDLPAPPDVERFRRATRLKGAFFKGVSKDRMSKEWLRKEISSKADRYNNMHQWTAYLHTFSTQIASVAEILRDEIDELELHDIAILDAVRLQKESEHLGDYLSWMLSEALAARIRRETAMVHAAGGLERIGSMPFQGLLAPKQILFSLYSDISFAELSDRDRSGKVQFGDVFRVITPENKTAKQAQAENPEADPVEAQRSRGESADFEELLLVIAPACDLQRCQIDDEVLCIRGVVKKKVADLADLLEHQAMIGKGNESFKHILRKRKGADVSFLKVEWYPQRITTVRNNLLVGQLGFVKEVRLNELLAQEVKEEALRQAGRIGVPVDPSFNSGLGVVIRINRKKLPQYVIEVDERSYIAGMFVTANDNNAARIIVSEEFIEELLRLIPEIRTWGMPNSEKIIPAIEEVLALATEGITLRDKFKQFSAGLKVRLLEKYVRGNKSSENEILFYPLGHIEEAAVIARATQENIASDPVDTDNSNAANAEISAEPDANGETRSEAGES